MSAPLGFMGLSPGPFEVGIVFVAVLVLFGARRIPEFARTMGKVMTELRRASNDFRSQLHEIQHEVSSEVHSVRQDIIDATAEDAVDEPFPGVDSEVDPDAWRAEGYNEYFAAENDPASRTAADPAAEYEEPEAEAERDAERQRSEASHGTVARGAFTRPESQPEPEKE